MKYGMSQSEKREYEKKKKNGIIIGASCGVMIVLFMIPWEIITGPSFEERMEQTEKYVEQEVLLDSLKQFKMTMRTENYMDAYMQAGIITATYLQAEDETNYVKWKDIETNLAKKLGLSF